MDLLDEDFYASPWALTRQLGNNTISVLYVITVLSQHHAFPSQLRVDLWRFINTTFGRSGPAYQAGCATMLAPGSRWVRGCTSSITAKSQISSRCILFDATCTAVQCMLSKNDAVAFSYKYFLHSAQRKRIRLVRMRQGHAVRENWSMIS